jgi:hypothetical protein
MNPTSLDRPAARLDARSQVRLPHCVGHTPHSPAAARRRRAAAGAVLDTG